MSNKTTPASLKTKLHFTGMSLSILCAVHCALLPIILLISPALSAGIANHYWVDSLIIASILVIGYFTIWMDFRKRHGEKLVVIAFVLGILLMMGGHFSAIKWLELCCSVAGGFLLAGAQYYSVKLARKAGKISCPGCYGKMPIAR